MRTVKGLVRWFRLKGSRAWQPGDQPEASQAHGHIILNFYCVFARFPLILPELISHPASLFFSFSFSCFFFFFFFVTPRWCITTLL